MLAWNYQRMMYAVSRGAVMQAFYGGGWATVTDPYNLAWESYPLRVAPFYAALEYGPWSTPLIVHATYGIKNYTYHRASVRARSHVPAAQLAKAKPDELLMYELFFAEYLADQGE